MTEPLKLGLAGLGTVGGGVLRLLAKRSSDLSKRIGRPIEIVAVSALNRHKNRDIDISGFRFVADPVELARDPEIDAFVELIGGEEGVAKDAVETALRAGKHVVTANKALLAHHGPALAALAEKHGVALNFEGAVAGGIPVVKAIRESLQGNTIARVYGILNGTCNYILTLMLTEGRGFADVLKDAQAQGYAEADPTFDIGGFENMTVYAEERDHRQKADTFVSVPVRVVLHQAEAVGCSQHCNVRLLAVVPLLLRSC